MRRKLPIKNFKFRFASSQTRKASHQLENNTENKKRFLYKKKKKYLIFLIFDNFDNLVHKKNLHAFGLENIKTKINR